MVGSKWLRRLEIIKTFPDGHTETTVAILYPAKKDGDLNPYFWVDGRYYYWGEGRVGCYRPSIKRVGYGKMTARILNRIERNEAMGISPVPPNPQPADFDGDRLMVSEAKCEV